MKTLKYLLVICLALLLAIPTLAAKTDPPEIPDTGQLYGDLYVILRDGNGVPLLSDAGCIQPISAVDASTTIETDDGQLVINVLVGEPFALPTYTLDGDLVECELTDAMTNWVINVDFGRLNMGRAPEFVLEHAFDEAINKLNTEGGVISLDPAGRLMVNDDTIDAPAENLALYIQMMTEGDWITEDTTATLPGSPPDEKGPPEGDGPEAEERPVLSDEAIAKLELLGFDLGDSDKSADELSSHELTLAASLLAAAADKTGSINLDQVVYINSIYGINQAGTLFDEETGKWYFDFGVFGYDRLTTYEIRGGGVCEPGWVWVLQPELDETNALVFDHFVAQCVEILAYEAEHDPAVNAVHFTDMTESYTTVFDESGEPLEYNFTDNVRGFTQAADDALQMIEYIHNYKIPEDLYGVYTETE